MVSIFTYRDERKLFALIGVVIVAALVALLQVSFARQGRTSPLTTLVTVTATYFEIVVAAVRDGTRGGFDTVARTPGLARENAVLREENLRLHDENVAFTEELARVPAERDIIRQDEYGNFMIVLLTGSIAVDRTHPWGQQMRLTEARPGDILGEMSLLDSGMRFSVCVSLTECEIAVLSAEALDDMMMDDPALAASVIALLARRLSMRLRVVSARLSDKPN